MAFSTTAGYPRSILSVAAKITSSDGTTLKTLVTAGADGALINSLIASSSDNQSRYLQVYYTKSGVDYLLGSVLINSLSGNNGNASVALLPSSYLQIYTVDSEGNRCLRLAAGDSLKLAIAVATSATKEIHISGSGVSY
jgi:hypothetical protein